MENNELNILLGIGGSGPTKRIPSRVFLDVIEKISKIKKCFSLQQVKQMKKRFC